MTIFHKQEPWWYPQAKGLAPGESVRINDSIKLSFNGRSYFLWDFREKEGEHYEPMMTLAEKVAHMQMVNAKNDEARRAVTLPMPAMKHPGDWPSAAAVWLYQAGLNNFSIAQMGCYWNPDLERVVVPFRRYSGEASWVARRTHGNGTGPKYLMPKDHGREGGGYYPGWQYMADTICLTEDLLSAYRVNKATGLNTLSCMGTSLDRGTRAKLAQRYGKVLLWMDPDEAGRVAKNQLARDLGALGLWVKRINSVVDPKLYSDEAIRKYCEEAHA